VPTRVRLRPLPKGIEIDGAICFGAPRIAACRVQTCQIKSMLLAGDSIATMIDFFPDLTVEDVENALRFEFTRHLYKKHIERANKDCKRIWREYFKKHPPEAPRRHAN
jgi:uncharacterized protein (DUF433 family)